MCRMSQKPGTITIIDYTALRFVEGTAKKITSYRKIEVLAKKMVKKNAGFLSGPGKGDGWLFPRAQFKQTLQRLDNGNIGRLG